VGFGAEWWMPWRRLVLSPAALRDEIGRAGLRAIHQDGGRCLCVAAD